MGQVSEVRQEGNLKFLYKLKVDEAALTKRNLIDKMTDYRKKTVAEATVANANLLQRAPSARKPDTARATPADLRLLRQRIRQGYEQGKYPPPGQQSFCHSPAA